MWKDIKNFEGYYQVSDSGEIRSIDRTIETARGTWFFKGKVLQPNVGTNGYLYVNLSKADKGHTVYIHRAVAETFLGKVEGLEVNHINSNKQDNRLENLEWLDRHTNASLGSRGKHKDNGMEKNPKAKKITCITTGETFGCIKEFALKYNLNYHTVKNKLQKGLRNIYGYEINFD